VRGLCVMRCISLGPVSYGNTVSVLKKASIHLVLSGNVLEPDPGGLLRHHLGQDHLHQLGVDAPDPGTQRLQPPTLTLQLTYK